MVRFHFRNLFMLWTASLSRFLAFEYAKCLGDGKRDRHAKLKDAAQFS
jgi:hypothetical protein